MKRLLVIVVICCFANRAFADEQRIVRYSGKFKSSDEITVLFTDRPNGAYQVKTIVIDVLPNGNLKIYGNQSFEADRRIRVYELSGIVRPRDISQENTIQSKQITNLTIAIRDIKKKKKKQRSKSRNHTARQKVRGQQKPTLTGTILKTIKWLLVL